MNYYSAPDVFSTNGRGCYYWASRREAIHHVLSEIQKSIDYFLKSSAEDPEWSKDYQVWVPEITEVKIWVTVENMLKVLNDEAFVSESRPVNYRSRLPVLPEGVTYVYEDGVKPNVS